MADLSVVVCLAFDHRAASEGLQKFKECILGCPFVDRAMEVCGTFDLIVQGHCCSLAEYTENMDRLRGPLSKFVTRIETSFVGKTIDRSIERPPVHALWLPCKDGRKRVDSHLINKVVAEGDYMRVYVADWSCLIHQTMDRLYEQLRDAGFLKLHRSWLVRIDFIERLVHEKHRWVARLLDGTHVGVAKSHIKDVLRIMTGESSNAQGHSSAKSTTTEPSGKSNEKLLQVTHQ